MHPIDISVRNDDYRSTCLLLNAGADSDVLQRSTTNLENLYSNLATDNISNLKLNDAMKFDTKYANFFEEANNTNFEALTNSLKDSDGLNYYERLASKIGISHEEIKSDDNQEELSAFEDTAKNLITTLQNSEQHADKFKAAITKVALSQASRGNEFLSETLGITKNITTGLEKSDVFESHDKTVSKDLWNEVLEFTSKTDLRNLTILNKRTAGIDNTEEQEEGLKRKATPAKDDSEQGDRAAKRLKTAPPQSGAISPENIRKQQESRSLEK